MQIFSPKEQYIIYPIFSLNFVINNVILYLLFAAFLTILLGKGISKGHIISNNWGILSESLFRTILLMIENFVGPKNSMLFSPMEQYIIYPVFSFNFIITNVIFYLLMAAFITILMGKGIMKGNILSNNWGILSESLFRTILKMIEDFVGPKFSIYLPLFYTVFLLVLFSNLLGLVPYTSTPTVEMVMTLSIAFTLLFGILLVGFLTHKLYILTIF